ncbi:hypothetical protein VPNG_08586 [Cytospora leucostoma]|uniref:Uncharacterized protein n=1 Tax=Cytospora leucostoma TaxID=1230097 RepID=A0A423W497_9PEZI|nr:hypothetical protein VPNG_08586 [Cytospora leucostoma]
MSGSTYGAQPSVESWLDGQYEYIVPDRDSNEHRGKTSYPPRDAYRNLTPEFCDEGSSRDKGHRYPKDKYHSTAKDRYTPATPPSEEGLERERNQNLHGSDQARRRDRDHGVDREEHRPRHDRDTRYPPKADHGRPSRPPLNSAATAPHLTAGQALKTEDPRRTSQRKHSQPSIPLRDRGDDKPTRSQHTRRNDDDDRSPSPARPSKKRGSRDDRDTRKDHHNTGSSRNTTTSPIAKPPPPRRPSLSHSQTTPYGRDPNNNKKRPGVSSSSHRSFSFLKDPRFMTAAEAALQAGATAALGSGGGKWGGDKGAKVLGASLSAAALSALRNSSAATAGGEGAEGRRGEDGGRGRDRDRDRGGRYVAGGREGGRRGAKRRY